MVSENSKCTADEELTSQGFRYKKYEVNKRLYLKEIMYMALFKVILHVFKRYITAR